MQAHAHHGLVLDVQRDPHHAGDAWQAVVNEDLAGDAVLLKAEIGRLADQLAQARAEIALHKV